MKPRMFVLAAMLTAGAIYGQEPQDPQDPPSRVARLNWIGGQVSFQPASLDTWTAATLNYPLTTGDHLYTDVGSRAEMHVGPNAIRLDSETNFGFLNLDDRTVQIRFTQGAMEVRLRLLDDQDLYEIDTPQGAISLLRTGDYRIDTDPQRNATMVTVRSGDAEVTANGNSFAVHPRQTAYFGDSSQPDIRSENPPDDFDRFTADHNMREDRIPPPAHVPTSMIGYEDLDANGVWSEIPEYGWCWRPRVAVGWAPFHYGHWAWVEPWGWTWIDDAPWGFAPFHYGRWAFATGAWVWIPGARVGRPVYAPHLVAFVGGARIGVAWFPLGPREPFIPGYHHSNRYIRDVNITHVTNINVTNINVTNIRYANQRVAGGVTVVPRDAFVGARPVHEFSQRIPPQELAQARVTGYGPMVPPQRESVLASVRTNGSVPRPPQAIMERQVVARSTPPPPAVSFEARQRILSQNQGRPLAPDEVRQLRQQQPAAVVNRGAFRSASAPAPQVPAAPIRPRDDRRPAFQGGGQDTLPPAAAPPGRMESRPPNTFPQSRPEFNRPVPQPENRPAPPVEDQRRSRPDFNRPAPQPENRPAPQPEDQRRSRPDFNRPAPQPENRPAPQPEDQRRGRPEFNRPAQQQDRPRPENRPAPEIRSAPPPERAQPRREEPRREEPRREEPRRGDPRRDDKPKDDKK